MKNSTILIILLMSFFSQNNFAQIVSTAIYHVDTLRIGDPVQVEIKVTIPADINIKGLDFSGFDSLVNKMYLQDTLTQDPYADLEILDAGNWKNFTIDEPLDITSLKINKSNDQQVISNTIRIAIYNTGRYTIPGPKVIYEGVADQLPTAAREMIVLLPEKLMKQDTVAFNPIKDIMREKADITDYLKYLYILAALALFAGVAYYFYKTKNKKVHIPLPIDVPTVPAHIKALDALSILDTRQLWQQGHIKEYQTGLTDIIRTYLEDRYGIRAPEMTTEEITSAVNIRGLDPSLTSKLKEILEIADLVKFAKATPDKDIHSSFMTKAVSFIEVTKEEKNFGIKGTNNENGQSIE